MKKIFFVIAICTSSLFPLVAQDQAVKIDQRDIDEFLGFADEYRALAKSFFKNAGRRSVSEIFYSTDNAKWLSETENFLKAKAWSFDKMSNFLYSVNLALLAIDYKDSYGTIANGEGSGLFDDVPQPLAMLVRKNLKALKPYFPEGDYMGYDETDLEPLETNDDRGGADVPNFTDANTVNSIRGDLVIDIKLVADVRITVKFDSGADELAIGLAIVGGSRVVKEGDKRVVKPWTVKGGHVETTWVFQKKDFRKGPHTARVTVTDADGFEVGSREVEFVVN